MDRVLFGKRLNHARKELQITSDELSSKCNINATFIRQIECAVKLPSLPTMVGLCNALGISPNYLLADSLIHKDQEHSIKLMKKIHTLSPKQTEVITALIDVVRLITVD